MAQTLRFYLKVIGLHTPEKNIKGWKPFSLYHGASHQYLDSFETAEECAEYIRELNSLTDKGLCRTLLFDYGVRLPHRDVVNGTRKDSGWQDSQDSYNKAWYRGTQDFFEEYPDCEVMEEIPFALFNEVHHEKQAEDARKEMARKKIIDQPIQKVTTVIKDGVKQLKVKLKPQVKLIDVSNPFAV